MRKGEGEMLTRLVPQPDFYAVIDINKYIPTKT
jgi:hypothetical protein